MLGTRRRALARGAVVGLALAGACLGGCGGSSSPADATPASSPAPTPPPPSLVLILTDDLDVPTTEALPGIAALMAEQGLSFSRAFVTHPVCGPSRASILTGQYTHNHGVLDNAAPLGGFSVFRQHEHATIATWLQDAGYRTALVGKYMNEYPAAGEAEHIPPGWDDWFGHLSSFEDGRYYNYWINDNGNVARYGAEPEDYSADVEARRAVEIIQESAGRPEPLFLYIAPEAPHRPATYAGRHGGEFRDAAAPRLPSFNEPDVSDKPVGVRQRPLTQADIDWLDKLQQWRLRSMRAVEEMTAAVIQALAETGRLENTFIFFTSDNGLLMGQHRFQARKRECYDEAVRVPLLVRGPGVRRGVEERLVLSIDLAATLVDLAGAPRPGTLDGRSLAPLLRGTPPADWPDEVLVENRAAADSLALRTLEWHYMEDQTGEVELYDMRSDPYQLESLHREADPALLQELHERAHALLACQGESCRR